MCFGLSLVTSQLVLCLRLGKPFHCSVKASCFEVMAHMVCFVVHYHTYFAVNGPLIRGNVAWNKIMVDKVFCNEWCCWQK